jgi:hypothetical protein
MTVPPAPAPAEWPWPDQDADLAAELDALLLVRAEPADDELTGLDVPPDAEPGVPRPDPCAEDWAARLDGAAPCPGPGAGFGDGGALDRLGPGAALAGFSQTVLDEGLGGLSDGELVGVLRASRRLAAWQDGIEMVAAAELDRRRKHGRPVCSAVNDEVAAELAAALVLTGRSADALMGLARAMAPAPTPPGARVPARPAAAEHGLRPAAHLLVPGLPPSRYALRPGPHPALRPRRADLRMQPIASEVGLKAHRDSSGAGCGAELFQSAESAYDTHSRAPCDVTTSTSWALC